MAAKCIVGGDGNSIGFTCENRKFKTNLDKGYSHGHGKASGSVFPEPLIDAGNYSLWLEHVVSTSGEEHYWLMWYDGEKPNIPMSGVFGKEDLKRMIGKLTELTIREELL